MSKLNVDQKNIKTLLTDKKSDFLIPDYQRPYAWQEEECQTLWEDIFTFAIPSEDATKFNSEDEYYLGPIVTFKNSSNKLEVIDGQQRLTTIMLLLRAFHISFGEMKDENSKKIKELIESCIWKTDEFGNANKNLLKIDSEVATDKDKDEFLSILNTGSAPNTMKSKYAENYRYFQKKIDEFLHSYPSYFSYLPARILNNCILLPIEADNQNTALRIFSTLNDRGLPLSDADIFKAQFYKYYSDKGEKEKFIGVWKELEEISEKVFHPISGTPMDELFTRYMYYERAKMGIKSSTTESLRRFYEKDSYKLLKNDYTLHNLVELANFWSDVSSQNRERFSDRVLNKLFVLSMAPNGMWTYFLSVYFMANKDSDGILDEEKLYKFLDKSTAFIWAYAFYNPGVNALRTPVYDEMFNLINKVEVTFDKYKIDKELIRQSLLNYSFDNRRPITKSMLAWWAFTNKQQAYLSLEQQFEIEHIYAKNRQEVDGALNDSKNLERLGNKSLLEKSVNIRVSDFRFEDKVKKYKGYMNDSGKYIEGTKIQDLLTIDNRYEKFDENDIESRNDLIINTFIDYLDRENLLI
ncbi:putative uncharacterized protein [Clostridium sp. CAG:451]|nr:putative uncharacterized protein [Clostridium sp. CAG:451]